MDSYRNRLEKIIAEGGRSNLVAIAWEMAIELDHNRCPKEETSRDADDMYRLAESTIRNR